MSAHTDIAFHPAPAADSAKNTAAGAGSLTSHDMTAGRTPMVEQPDRRCFGPIVSEPHGLRPPYDRRDSGRVHGARPGETTEQWRQRIRCDRLDALCAPLLWMDVSAYEYSVLCWLCGWEDHTVAVVAALLHRARAAAPLASGGHTPAGGER